MSNFTDHFDKDMRVLQAVVPPTREQVLAIQPVLNCAFPEDYIQLLTTRGAIYVEAIENVWPRPQLYDVKPYWEMLYAVMVTGIPHENERESFPDMLNILVLTSQFKEMFGSDLIPVLKWQGASSITCFDKAGQLWTMSYAERENPERIEKSSRSISKRK